MSGSDARRAETAAALAVVAWRLLVRPLAEAWADLLLVAAVAWLIQIRVPDGRRRQRIAAAAALALLVIYAWRHLPVVLDHLRLVL